MKKLEKANIVFNAMISLIIALFFFVLCNVNTQGFFIKRSHVFPVNSTVFTKILHFPVEGDYILQLKYDNSDTDVEVATLNRYRLEVKAGNDSSNSIASRYYYVPGKIIKKRNNFLKIKFYPSNPPEIDVRIQNYLVSIADGNLVFTLKNAMVEFKNFQPRLLFSLGFFLFSFIFWNMLTSIQVRFFELSMRQSIVYNCISFSTITLLFFIFGGLSLKGPYVLVFAPQFLIVFFLVLTIFTSCVINFLPVLIEFFAKMLSASSERNEKVSLPSLVKDAAMWIYKSRLSEKFILVFMTLFIIADILYNSGLVNYAENIAGISLCILTVGIVLCFISSMKEKA